MASTTLVTFILNSVHATTAVDVLGSWDNFSQPYPMQKDLQKGHGSWYGCHVFKNIICDGDPTDCCKPRNGGLVTGGTYWYFYRRNFDKEFHNPEQPSTSNCPLLPGQTVNVLVVPKDDSHSQDELRMTMDPKDRLRAPTPASKHEQPRPIALTNHAPQRLRNPLYSSTLARLQTGVGDTVISAYMQNRRSEDLISCRHPAASRAIRSASGCSMAVEFHSSTALQRRTTRRRKHTTGGTRPVSRLGLLAFPESDTPLPGKTTREYTNPFLLGTIPDEGTEDELQTHTDFFVGNSRPSRPASSNRPTWPSNSHFNPKRVNSSPSSLPSGALRTRNAKSDELRISGATLIANVEEEMPIQVVPETKEQDNSNMEWLNHPPEDLHQAKHAQEPMSPSSPEMTPGATTPSNARPPTRSKSQKLKRLASLKARIKLPHVPSMPKLKGRRPSTRHEAEEPSEGKRAVFNEASSTWTPAMTSPSESSPGFLSPEMKPMANKSLAGSPQEQFSMPLLHQPALHREDKVAYSPVDKSRQHSRLMRGDSLPRMVNNFLPGAFSEQPNSATRSRVDYPARKSSLPPLLSDAGAASSQETIRQSPRQPVSRHNKEATLAQGSALADFKFGWSQTKDRPPSAYSFDSGDDAPPAHRQRDSCESFDEAVHRDQIRHLLRDGTASGLHDSSGLSHKASLGVVQSHGAGAGAGADKEEAFGAESFEYLAAAIY